MIGLKNITLTYKENKIFDSFSYKIEDSSKLLLNAPSGTGKTSFFRLLLGFTSPDEGEISFDGQKLSANTVKDIRRKIAYLSQDVDVPSGQVRLVVNTILNYKFNKGLTINEDHLLDLLDYFELGRGVLEKNVDELSGGERQRLMLVVLILLDREVYLLDEPTSALDINLKYKIRDYFLQMPAAVIVISHDKEWNEDGRMSVLDWTKPREGQ